MKALTQFKGQCGEPWEIDEEDVLDRHGRHIDPEHPVIRARVVSCVNHCDGGNPEAIQMLLEACQAGYEYAAGWDVCEKSKQGREAKEVARLCEAALAKWKGTPEGGD